MYRLSIVVPRLGAIEPFEDTLVSVLQNRPSDCEVLVPHAGPYHDPYQLADEVRFIERPSSANLTELINAGCRAGAGEIVHTLHPGMVVEERWAEAAIGGFAEPRVAAVAPLVLNAARLDRVLAAGIRYAAAGKRIAFGRGARRQRAEELSLQPILGPWLAAAFYRRSAWQAAGGFCEHTHPAWADVELALILQRSGFRAVLRAESVIRGPAAYLSSVPSYDLGLSAERIYWRQSAQSAGDSRLLAHIFAVCSGLLRQPWRPAAYAELLGRLASWLDLVDRRRESARLQRAEKTLAAIAAKSDSLRQLPRSGGGLPPAREGAGRPGFADRRASEAA